MVFIIRLLLAFILIFSSAASGLTISPPFLNFKGNQDFIDMSLSNNSDLDKAIYIEPEYVEGSHFYLISSAETLVIPSRSVAKVNFKILGDFDKKREHLMYVNIVEMVRAPEENASISYLSITNKIKVIITPSEFDNYNLSLKDGFLLNSGPKYIQLLSLVCHDNIEVKEETLIQPFSSFKIKLKDSCNPIAYKESIFGKIKTSKLVSD